MNFFRESGYTVEMDVMNCNERVDLGPSRWAEQQIKNALNVFVFLSPGLLHLCGNDDEAEVSSHQVLCKDQSEFYLSLLLYLSKVTSRFRASY